MSALRGRGVYPKAEIVLELSKGGCMNLRTRGRGSENPKFLRMYLMEATWALVKKLYNFFKEIPSKFQYFTRIRYKSHFNTLSILPLLSPQCYIHISQITIERERTIRSPDGRGRGSREASSSLDFSHCKGGASRFSEVFHHLADLGHCEPTENASI